MVVHTHCFTHTGTYLRDPSEENKPGPEQEEYPSQKGRAMCESLGLDEFGWFGGHQGAGTE